MTNALLFAIVRHNFLTALEVFMEFTCHTAYSRKALTAMARAVRKTVRAKTSRWIRLYSWVIIGLLLISLWLSWGKIWQTAANCAVLAALLLVSWKEDAINGYLQSAKPCRARTFPIPYSIPTTFS